MRLFLIFFRLEIKAKSISLNRLFLIAKLEVIFCFGSNLIKLEFTFGLISKASGGNFARALLFWPAWAQSLNNADDAILAANNRSFHLIKVMRKKKCPGAENLEANIIDKPKNVVETNLAEQLKTLKDLYEDGHLSEEEYTKAKKKIID